MTRDGGRQRGEERGGRDGTSADPAPLDVGKRTLTQGLVQMKAEPASQPAPPVAASADPPVLAPAIRGGLGEGAEDLLGRSVQRKGGAGEASEAVHEAASAGIQDPGQPLPFRDVIQPAFGEHDVTGIRAHTGPEASAAARQIGATAYATGHHVAFAGAPDLHTAAHEATHVVQQRAGVHLKGGVGEAGDAHEREADEVADRVVAGQSAAPVLDRYGPLSAASSGVGVQRQEADAHVAHGPSSAPTEAVDPPAPGDNKPGFIDNDDGANIRNRPAELAGSKTLTDTPLPPATRVFVSGRHPQTADWWYVTATLPDATVRGYVQGLRVTTDLPELTAKLHQVKSGDTAEGLAVQEFSSAVRDGHDLRFYENVLLYVNRQHGRAGVRGSYQDPGLLGGGANNVQLEAGRRIWLVSPAYARALEGVVPDGSLTNGAVAKVKRFAGHVEDLLKSVDDFPKHVPEVAGEYGQAIHDHAAEIIGITAAFLIAEAASMALAATPGGQIPAVMIQLALAAFGAHGMAVATVEALKHAGRWLEIAWHANGREEDIAAASKEFVRMLVSVAMAALAFMGVKGNMGKAVAIAADSMPAMMPALAVIGGGEVGGAGAGTAVAAGVPQPYGPLGTAMAMSTKDGEGSGSEQETPASDKKPSQTAETAPQAKGSGIDEANLSSPAARHKAASVKMKTVAKADNTVIEPGVDVAADVAAIRSGTVPRIKGQYTVNGRTYGSHDGTLYPISGTGFHYLTRPQFKALGVYNEFGNTARAAEILDNMGIAAADRAEGLRVHEVIQ